MQQAKTYHDLLSKIAQLCQEVEEEIKKENQIAKTQQ